MIRSKSFCTYPKTYCKSLGIYRMSEYIFWQQQIVCAESSTYILEDRSERSVLYEGACTDDRCVISFGQIVRVNVLLCRSNIT